MPEADSRGSIAFNTKLHALVVGCGGISVLSSISDTWSTVQIQAPGALVALLLFFACVKLTACIAYARRLRWSVGAFLLCFLAFSALDLSFLLEYPWNSLATVPTWNLRLFSGLALLLAIVEVVGASMRRQAEANAA